jgi:Ca2+-binding EF-hand superfamily protein
MKPSTIIIACALLVGGIEVYLADGHRRTFGSGALQEHMAIYDADEDGKISVEELQALRADQENRRDRLRNRWDTNNDGRISEKEREGAKEEMRRLVRERRSQRFDDEDIDADGNLTRAEFLAITAVAETDPTVAREIFNRLDEDGDSQVSKAEFLKSLDRIRIPVSDVEPQAKPKPHPDAVRSGRESPVTP